MRKNKVFAMAMCFGLMCVGCQNSDAVKVTETGQAVVKETEQVSVETVEPMVSDKIQEDGSGVAVEQNDSICFTTSLEGTSLVVKNMETNEILHTYKPDKESLFGEEFMAKINDGYIAVNYTEQMQLLSVFRFDQNLELLEEIALKDILPEEVTGNCMGAVFTKDGKKMILKIV